MNLPEDRHYTRDHEWTHGGPSVIRVGITDYAQQALGDIVFVQLPEPGAKVQVGMTFAEVESTKSVSDVYAPVTGVVAEVNTALSEHPEKVNEDPYGEGWICSIELAEDADTESFLDASQYRALLGED